MSIFRPRFAAALTALAFLVACSSDEGATADDDDVTDEIRPGITTEDESDVADFVELLDTDGSGHPDIVRHVEKYQDPRDETRQRRRIRKLEIDANNDQNYNVIRFYDEHGNLKREKNDHNLDGQIDTILYYSGGELTRKELKDETGEYIEERRIYYDGELSRVDTDHNGDGNIDRWEYYDDGVLMRIGRDTVGDGAADTWQLR